ncbi:protein of unknown function [Pseudodesulfovibrio piezophilus C1TLV30]|uniref:Uncharacterized protein n=1 Tax=Pseudodesulfovibrio piezophilus (strain DSM 21447 / JCM 15486 / C1TLV30) TaxID=1322246 RepID=M1WKQ8_PSEP2|nr:protein of unknown function [Pseudodesulfovibrio piezophilus C1TLV30]
MTECHIELTLYVGLSDSRLGGENGQEGEIKNESVGMASWVGCGMADIFVGSGYLVSSVGASPRDEHG